jgi:tetratricopeptide (TPR) repeat protein
VVALVYPLVSSRYHLERGLTELARGNEIAAKAEFDKAIRINATSAAAFDQRAQLYTKRGEKDQALADFNEALRWSPYSQSVLKRRAALLLSMKQYKDAVTDYDKLLPSALPGEYFLYGNRAIAYAGLKDYQSAIRDYSEALKLAPDNGSLFLGRGFCQGELSHYDAALEDCKKAAELEPNNCIPILKCGWCYQSQSNFQKAKEEYDRAIAMEPKSAEGFIYSGYCFLEQKNASDALADLTQAINLNSRDARGYLGRARAYEMKGEYQNAITDLAVAVNVDPTVVVESSARCGALNQKLGNYRAAIENYSETLQHQPMSNILLERALCLDAAGDPERACQDCDEAIKLTPADQVAYLRRAQFNKELGRTVGARQDLEQALQLDPKYYEAYLARGSLYLELHEYEKACDDFNQAATLKPDSEEAKEKLKLASQDIKDSQSITEHCIIADKPKEEKEQGPPASADVNTLLNFGYHDLYEGKVDEATTALIRAVKKEPNDPRARRYLAYALINQDEQFEAIRQFEALGQLGDQNKEDQLTLSDALKSVERVKDAVVVLQKCFENNPLDARVKIKLNTAQQEFEKCGGNLKLATKSNCDVSPMVLRALAGAKPPEEKKEPEEEQNQQNVPPSQPGQTPNIQG